MFKIKILLHKAWIRILKVTAAVITIPKPMVYTGPGAALRLATVIAQSRDSKVLLITDNDLFKLGLHTRSMEILEASGIAVTIFSDISPNPTVEQIDQGLEVATKHQCNTVLAIGGGSPIDAAKVIAARISNSKSTEKLAGLFRVRKPLPPLYAVPTTAGTGSESTIGAVITHSKERRKLTIADPKLVPIATALDPELQVGLPPSITAMTGIDALTHGIETYLSGLATARTRQYSITAIRLIFANLPQAYAHGHDTTARENMALAAYYAGLAINEAALGYVHAIAHQLGGHYNIAHGLANAVVLPHVLRTSTPHVENRLSELLLTIEPDGDFASNKQRADAFIEAVQTLTREVGIAPTLDMIEPIHFEKISSRATQEAFDYYAVPKYITASQIQDILTEISSG